MSCEGSDCEPPDEKRPTPSPTSGTGSCPHPGYVRRLPRVQYVRDGVVVSNVSLESFRATGGYTLYGLHHRDVNNNYRRVALQFNFWRPVTIAAIRLVHTRVGLLKVGPTGRWVSSRVLLLPRCMECRRGLAMRILSVRPSVTRVNCDKTVERSVQIFTPYERSFSLVY